MRIGFFDSGVGGLTVLHEAMKTLKSTNYIYYADTQSVPYGSKTRVQVKDNVFRAVDFMIGQGIDVLVVACNTATSVAIEDLRKAYALPIIGMEPAVKPAVENHKDKRVLVTATELTLKEDKLKKLITQLDCEDIVDLLPLPGLVDFAERSIFDENSVMEYLDEAFSGHEISRYQTVVLGCTHFIFFKDFFRNLLGLEIDIIDGNKGTVNMLVRTLKTLDIVENGSGQITYYHSGREVCDTETLARYDLLLKRLEEIQ